MRHVFFVVTGLSIALLGCSGEERSSLAELRQLVAHHARLRSESAGVAVSVSTARAASGAWLAAFGPPGAPRQWSSGFAGGRGVALGDAFYAADESAEPASGLSGPLPGFWETVRRDLRSMPDDLWHDTKAVYTSAPNLLILGLTYGGSLALQETGPDNTIEDSLRRRTMFKGDLADAFGALGNPAAHFGIAGLWYLAGQQRQDDETYRVGKTLFSALIINGLSTTAGKLATWDKSPNGEYFSFPSGHTSSSFTVASVLHEAYGPWVGVPLYALSTLVAAERIDSGEHYFSDVIMGGVMGLVIGHSVAGEHDFELFGGRIVPFADPYLGATGIAWHKQF